MSNCDSPDLVLVDGSSYLYRAFHALPPLSTSSGQPTGAAKGVINMIRRLQKDYPRARIAVVFDASGKTFRDELFAEYKAHRPPMPDELRSQIEPIHAIIHAMGLPLLCVEGVEADDVIGTLVTRASEHGWHSLVSTGDKDMAQLVSDRVTLVNTMTDTVLDPDGVESRYGVPPDRIVDLLALMGDKVDNIPGVPGVGEKTALALVQGIGGVDQIYRHLDKVAELPVRGAKSLGEKLANAEDNARLSHTLATIKTDVALDFGPEDLAPATPDRAALVRLYRDLEFKSWIAELEEDPKLRVHEDAQYEVITDDKQFQAWVEKLTRASEFAFDTETTSLNYIAARVVGVSFAVEPGTAAYVPFGHDYLGAPRQLSEHRVLGTLKPLLEDADVRKIGQHLKFDKNVLANHDICLRGIAADTMLESYVLNSTATRHDMDSLALKYLGRRTILFEDIAGKGGKQLSFNQVPLEQAGPYAAEDADVTLQLHRRLYPMVAAEPGLKAVLEEIELPLVPVLSRIERNGALVDTALLAAQSREMARRLAELELEACNLAGGEFNLGSPKQLGEILFDRLGLPVIRKTPTGAPSTSEEVLQELALDYPLPKVIIEHRGLAKLKSTYTDKLPGMVNDISGRIHTSYHQAVTATGRLSSSDPNLQNIPVRTPEGRRIRQAFVAPKGYRLVAADYSQIELRIMAHLSGDDGLCAAFAEGRDIHSATAAEVFGVPLDQISANQRRSAKAINFGLIYGMSAFGLARQLQVGRQQAQQYIDLYFERYPGVAAYMDATRRQAAENGYVETLFGRRLYLPEIRSANAVRRQAAERTAINAPMQGTAADIIKRAMISVDHWLEESGIAARMIMQVHDELVFEVKSDQIDTVKGRLRELMAEAAELRVPLVVDVGVGANWDEAH